MVTLLETPTLVSLHLETTAQVFVSASHHLDQESLSRKLVVLLFLQSKRHTVSLLVESGEAPAWLEWKTGPYRTFVDKIEHPGSRPTSVPLSAPRIFHILKTAETLVFKTPSSHPVRMFETCEPRTYYSPNNECLGNLIYKEMLEHEFS